MTPRTARRIIDRRLSLVVDQRASAPDQRPTTEARIPDDERPNKPLTPATFHILLSVAREPAHGYAIKRMVEERTEGAVLLGAGTLYAGLQRMTGEGLIEETEVPPEALDVEPGSRWRFYRITRQGREVLEAEVARLEADLQAARGIVRRPA